MRDMSVYPVQYAQHPPEERNRLTVFFRIFMIIPHAIVGFFYVIGAMVCTIVAWFAIVFTGQYPEGLYNFNRGFLRFYQRFFTYWYCVDDEFPPFDGGEHPEYPVVTAIGEPLPEYNRLKTLFRIIIGIPPYIINQILGLWAFVLAIVLWFSAVFTGRTSESLIELMRMPMAYLIRSTAYFMLLTEDWPPFDPGPNQIEGVHQPSLSTSPEAL